MKVLIVLTSHHALGDTGKKTGFWLEELAAPYYVFKNAGANITLASPKGGQAPLDPVSNDPAYQTESTRRFEADAEATAALASTVKLSHVSADDFDTVFYPGGHGPMWDLAEDRTSIALIEAFWKADRPIGFVCHGPAALRHAVKADGAPLVEGLALTCWTNSEEDAVGLSDVVPFLLETEMRKLGGQFERTDDWGVHVVTDGLLTTGQNPASSASAASRLLEQFATVDS
ncbi:type 1 glutamine amidotransferase domain-containing protein [Pelagibius sp. 7325]|uniref:type 1 glutamine amidotransferase domain-containing protein n=1 Tax=Pelagibius sp. 7325 TaxID=3131994 RepID=UPI0030EF3E98